MHPGYGFRAENACFAQAVIDSGLIWIGPLPETIADMGEKDKARTIAEAAGLPVLPGSRPFAGGELEGLLEAARKIGYPLLVKASAGGGGSGRSSGRGSCGGRTRLCRINDCGRPRHGSAAWRTVNLAEVGELAGFAEGHGRRACARRHHAGIE